MTPDERAAVQRRAAARARARGLKADPPPTEPAAVLPTLLVGPLRQMLQRGHLTPAQAALARQLFAARAAAEAEAAAADQQETQS